ncbi:MAG: DUF72 domain-containing protein [Candidatus Baltobacteraceae bacterium]
MIYVGTCGFSYKDWLGTFYPATARGSEMLPFYSAHFSAVEIDSSFYGVPAPQTVARLLKVTPSEFRFCFKVPQTVTHTAAASGAVHTDAKTFVESVLPIAAAKKFGAALVQLPNGFRPNAETRRHLRAMLAALEPLPLVVEFRNREWQTPQTFELLTEMNAGWCNVDMPSYETLMHPSSDVTGVAGYVRFHGRNSAQWWTGDNTTRYDYDYSPEELAPWTDRIAEIDERIEATYAFFNNHARGNAARNAGTLLEMLQARYGPGAPLARPKVRLPEQPGLFD